MATSGGSAWVLVIDAPPFHRSIATGHVLWRRWPLLVRPRAATSGHERPRGSGHSTMGIMRQREVPCMLGSLAEKAPCYSKLKAAWQRRGEERRGEEKRGEERRGEGGGEEHPEGQRKANICRASYLGALTAVTLRALLHPAPGIDIQDSSCHPHVGPLAAAQELHANTGWCDSEPVPGNSVISGEKCESVFPPIPPGPKVPHPLAHCPVPR